MTAPKRIQRKRTKGWRMPEGAVYVGRPTRWGNPYIVKDSSGEVLNPWSAVQLYETFATEQVRRGAWQNLKQLLGGKDLVCWCDLKDTCHADVLLRLANE